MNGRERSAVEPVAMFNRADYDAIRAILTPGFTYEETGTGLSVQGADDFVAALQVWRTSAPDVAGEVLTVVASGDTAVLEIVWRGT